MSRPSPERFETEPSNAQPLVVINIDDVGMCHGANVAFLELHRQGACDSGSVMVPCPWFLEIAEAGAADPSLNLGVHLTLNSEKRHYRWRPLTKAGQSSGLVDGDGYFWRTVPELRRNAQPNAVEEELRAQIDAALAAGLKPNHVDGHMGAVYAPEFIEIYVQLGFEYGLPMLFPRGIAAYDPRHNLGEVNETTYDAPAARVEAAGQILADRVLETPWHREDAADTCYRALFSRIGPGVTFMALHANAPGEIEVIEPDSARIRIEEYWLLVDPDFRTWLSGIPMRRGSLRDLTNPERRT